MTLYTPNLISISVLFLGDSHKCQYHILLHEVVGTWIVILYVIPSEVSSGPVSGRMLGTWSPGEIRETTQYIPAKVKSRDSMAGEQYIVSLEGECP